VERTPAKVGLSIVQEEDNSLAGPVTTLPDLLAIKIIHSPAKKMVSQNMPV
jgi:hypothetical protein